MVIEQLIISLRSLIVLSVLTGVLYPLAMTGLSQALFSRQANGSILYKEGKPLGSVLIGQPFDDPKYFWSRPSATSPAPYNASGSSGSNLGPLSPALVTNVQGRIDALRRADPANTAPIPVDLVTASASGLDPHITPAATAYQLERVARVRGLAPQQVAALVQENTRGRWMGMIGEPTVNALTLNLALDDLKK